MDRLKALNAAAEEQKKAEFDQKKAEEKAAEEKKAAEHEKE